MLAISIHGRRHVSRFVAGLRAVSSKQSSPPSSNFVSRNIRNFGILIFSGGSSRSMSSTAAPFRVSNSNSNSSSSYLQHIKSQTDRIVTSKEDKRSYRGIELKNGLKVLLVSDPTADKSAASLDVSVGHMKDPRHLPGLAHFCEHMLFMGTKKYPDENEYQKFLSTHGGSSNAYTATDHTNYHFDVAPEYLEGAIDRFAQFFLSPLFTADATDREVNAVDSEHSNNVQNDIWRLAQLERTFSDPSHDYHKFGTGNKKTLLEDAKSRGLDPREELLKFHQQFYSSNLMGICVVAKESLDDLASMVVPLMAEVEDKQLARPEWPEHPYGPEQLGYRCDVVPVKDLRSLHVSFPIPDLHPQYRSNPGHYVGHLLGHEGPGSLLSELKNRGWVNALTAGPRTGARGFGFFTVDFELSEDGLEHVEEIVELMFAYVRLLDETGAQEWIHRECEDLNKMHFHFKDKEKPLGYASSLSHALHYYPMDEVLFGPYMMPDYRADLIQELLSKLNPSNMGYAVISKQFEGQTDQKETWYGTEYRKSRLDPKLLERYRLSNYKSAEELFRLPSKNEFIPTNFNLYEPEAKIMKKSSIIIGNDSADQQIDQAAGDQPDRKPTTDHQHTLPELLIVDELSRVWYKQDDEFHLPKCCVLLHLRSPLVYSDPLHASLAYMYVDLLRDCLTEYTYNAELAGLKYGLENGKYGISLSVSGYNEKQHVLMEKLVERMRDFRADPRRFEILKERYVRSLKNFAMEQPYQHAIYYTALLLSERCWTKDELLAQAEGLTVEMLNAFVQRFLSGLFIEALIHGNTNKETATRLIAIVKDTLKGNDKLQPLFSTQLQRDREICLPEGSGYIFEAENTTHSNSSVEVYFQTGVEETRRNMLLELLVQIVQEPCFDQLRTKEQLGYIVFSGVRRAHGTQGVRFIVQSDRSPEYVESRLELFLIQMHDELVKMEPDEFEKHKKALAARRLEKPKKLTAQAVKYWSEITTESYNFDRDYLEVQDLEKITKEELLAFFEESISLTAPKRRKLSVFVFSSPAEEARKAGKPLDGYHQSMADLQKAAGDGFVVPEAQKINDIVGFKSSLPLHPLPRPFMAVPAAGVKSPKSML